MPPRLWWLNLRLWVSTWRDNNRLVRMGTIGDVAQQIANRSPDDWIAMNEFLRALHQRIGGSR